MQATNSLIGNIIADKYRLTKLLGEGGSGCTYEAIEINSQDIVAIKILSLRHLKDWKQLELFEREAKVLSQLNHPQIPKYLEYFHVDTSDNRAFYIVQQLAPGKPLTESVQSGWHGNESIVRDIAQQLLEILQYLHRQSPPLIHRDIKPHNIIRNDEGKIFLVDFGAVQNVYQNTLLKGNTVAGTYGYMAPEQFRGMALPASDLYGVGATVLYLLTHRSPADLPQERLKLSFRNHVNISNHFADWLEVMLEPNVKSSTAYLAGYRFPTTEIALKALKKQQRFEVKHIYKINFPWKAALVSGIILTLGGILFYQYRYYFLRVVGLQPKVCEMIDKNDLAYLTDYLDHGGSVNISVQNSVDDGSILDCAIESANAQATLTLLQRGANPNVRSSRQLTSIHRAANKHPKPQRVNSRMELKAIRHHLVSYKVDINALDNRRMSPLMLAVEQLDYEMVEELIKLGADPYILDDSGSSLWHILASNPFSGIEESKNAIISISLQLRDAKVDSTKPNKYGESPIETAKRINNHIVTGILSNSYYK
jgi:serine/threonine protein kinase